MTNRAINILPDSTIVKIAAGEIIENPASIIKELVENSIDANSKNINIAIKNNGKDLIKVDDDGLGIGREDLNIAFKRHTTSKMSALEDLNNIYSLGFRGEALSSIAYVSNLEVITKESSQSIGSKAIVGHDGSIIAQEDIVTSDGTSIFAKNLFDNIPVRDKYLESRNYEINKTNEMVTKLALSRLDIGFEYYRDNRLVLKTDPKLGIKNNIYSILGSEISNNLEYIQYKGEDFNIKGYVSNNRLYRSNRKNQFLFINNRSVNIKEISEAIEKSFQSVIPLNRYPVFILYLELDNKFLDINIHPKKDVVKITNITDICNVIERMVSSKLLEISSVPNIKSKEVKEKSTIFEDYSNYEDFIDERYNIGDNTVFEEETNYIDSVNTHMSIYDKNIISAGGENPINNNSLQDENIDQVSIFDKKDNTVKVLENGYRYIGTFLNKYILLEDAVEESIYFLDQHAAHERINYEKLKFKEEQYVKSPYTQNNLPIIMNTDGEIFIDYRSDFMTIMQENNYRFKKDEDIRYIYHDQSPFVPVYSLPYTEKNNEPIFKTN